jgi:hypothetical protein
MLKREMAMVRTPYGDIAVKNAYLQGQKIRSKPEYEDCKKLAREKGLSLQDIYDSLKSGDGG